MWFSPIKKKKLFQAGLIHSKLFLVYIQNEQHLLFSVVVVAPAPNYYFSLHITVLCSSDFGNGYQNEMEDSAQESV